MNDIFKSGLNSSLEHLRGFAVSIIFYNFIKSGLYAEIKKGNTTVKAISDRLHMNPVRIKAILNFLRAERLLSYNNDSDMWCLNKEAEALYLAEGWLELLVGGYGNTVLQLTDNLHSEIPITRNFQAVGSGSCKMSNFGAFPLLQSMFSSFNTNITDKYAIIDFGCGDGAALATFLKHLPNSIGYGFEYTDESIQNAKQYLSTANLANKTSLYKFEENVFFDKVLSIPTDYKKCIVFSFVLHEILGQHGDGYLQDFLVKIRELLKPHALLIIEVDYNIDKALEKDPVYALGYYNLYNLLHDFTGQKLETIDYWRTLFSKTGFEIKKMSPISESIDPTNLEIGFYLE